MLHKMEINTSLFGIARTTKRYIPEDPTDDLKDTPVKKNIPLSFSSAPSAAAKKPTTTFCNYQTTQNFNLDTSQ